MRTSKIICYIIILISVIPVVSIPYVNNKHVRPEIIIEQIGTEEIKLASDSDVVLVSSDDILNSIIQNYTCLSSLLEKSNSSKITIINKNDDYIYKITITIAVVGGKLDGVNILNNTKRLRIYNYILSNPGSHLRQIMRHHGFGPNQTSYHLATLERHGMVTSYHDGRYKQYYINLINNELYDHNIIKIFKNENAKYILYNIFNHQELSRYEIRNITNLHRNTISKIVKQIKFYDIIEETTKINLTPKGIKYYFLLYGRPLVLFETKHDSFTGYQLTKT